jgi:hypothetical protein
VHDRRRGDEGRWNRAADRASLDQAAPEGRLASIRQARGPERLGGLLRPASHGGGGGQHHPSARLGAEARILGGGKLHQGLRLGRQPKGEQHLRDVHAARTAAEHGRGRQVGEQALAPLKQRIGGHGRQVEHALHAHRHGLAGPRGRGERQRPGRGERHGEPPRPRAQ